MFDAFSEFGRVRRVSIGRSPTGDPRGFAHVEFFEVGSAENAYGKGVSVLLSFAFTTLLMMFFRAQRC